MTETGSVEIARITITRTISDNPDPGESDAILVECTEGMTLLDALGLLRFAEDSLIQKAK